MASDAHHLRGCWVRFAIDLHPSKSADVLQGVREQLQSMLLRYSHELQGVMLAYSKEKVLSSEAKIHPYFPYFHVDVSALVYLFRPIVGALMTGVVNAVGQDYIGVLVLGIFNAAIGREDIPSHWRSAPLERCWLSTRNKRQRVRVGSTLRFAVHRIHHEGGFFTLAGSLNRPGVSLDAAGTQPTASPPATVAAAKLEAATAAARKVSKRRQKEAAGVAAAESPAGTPVARQPSHRKESKKRQLEPTIESTGAASVSKPSSAVKQPKQKKRKAVHETT